MKIPRTFVALAWTVALFAACSGAPAASSLTPAASAAGSAAASTAAFPFPGVSGPIKVGVLLPATGPNGPGGQRMLAGLQIAVDQINASGGILGHQIQLITMDEQGTPAVAVSKAQDLVSQNVQAVLGGLTSTVALAYQPILANADIMDLTITAAADDILSGKVNQHAIRLNANAAIMAGTIAAYVNSKAYKNVVILQQNDTYGTGQADALKAAIKSPVKIIPFDPKTTDFRVELDLVKAANPDAVILVNAAADTGMPALIQQYKAADIRADAIAPATLLAQSTIDLAGKAAEGLVSAQPFIADQPPFSTYKATQDLVKAFQAKAGQLPNHEVAFGFTAAIVYAQGVTAAKSLKRADVANAIKSQKITGTPFGDVTFDKQGQMHTANDRLQLYRVENGKIKTFDL